MDETKITKLSEETFLVQYADGCLVLKWPSLIYFYANTLNIEIEQMEQIIESIERVKIGETFDA